MEDRDGTKKTKQNTRRNESKREIKRNKCEEKQMTKTKQKSILERVEERHGSAKDKNKGERGENSGKDWKTMGEKTGQRKEWKRTEQMKKSKKKKTKEDIHGEKRTSCRQWSRAALQWISLLPAPIEDVWNCVHAHTYTAQATCSLWAR